MGNKPHSVFCSMFNLSIKTVYSALVTFPKKAEKSAAGFVAHGAKRAGCQGTSRLTD